MPQETVTGKSEVGSLSLVHSSTIFMGCWGCWTCLCYFRGGEGRAGEAEAYLGSVIGVGSLAVANSFIAR